MKEEEANQSQNSSKAFMSLITAGRWDGYKRQLLKWAWAWQ